jgi:AAA15 family ATPase/GTPase
MLRVFSIRNFRCFENFKIEPLERVNLIAGKNNAGKTALLEAIFLHLGAHNPELPLRINFWRDIDYISPVASETWGWLFFNKESNNAIELMSISDNQDKLDLEIRLGSLNEQTFPLQNGELKGSTTTEPEQQSLRFEYRNQDQSIRGTAEIRINGDGSVRRRQDGPQPFPLSAFLHPRSESGREDAERFSNLEVVRRQDEVISYLQLLEPRLKKLAVLVRAGKPSIFADVGLTELLPISLMGDGIGRFLRILLTLLNIPNGVMLVDEIENGLHYSTLTDVWRVIGKAARELNVQVFATTHSYECIRAAHQSFASDNVYDFRYHRLERSDNTINVFTYDKDMLEVAPIADLEIR